MGMIYKIIEMLRSGDLQLFGWNSKTYFYIVFDGG